MTKKYRILISYAFLGSLLLLLLNDFVLKGMYGNWLTGKLSDFAGLFIFPLFWAALFPRYKTAIFWLTGFTFILWKSPYSQGFINMWNSAGLFAIGRVVDYTDLIALTMLPLAWYADNYKDKLKVLKVNPVFPLVLASFAFLATSYTGKMELNESWAFDFSQQELLGRISDLDDRHNYSLYSENANDIVVYGKDTFPAYVSGYRVRYDTLYNYEKKNIFSQERVRAGIDTIMKHKIPIRDTIYTDKSGLVRQSLYIEDFEKRVNEHYCSRISVRMKILGDDTQSSLSLTEVSYYNCMSHRRIDEEDKKRYFIEVFEAMYITLNPQVALRNEGLKCAADAGSADMSTVTVAIATVRSGILSISADGVQFRHVVANYLRI